MQPKVDATRRITAPGRSRGRPRAFDREAALDRALGLFWTQGFEGTSISDLTSALDINPPSLYAAFGSKEELFREALGLYMRDYGFPIAFQRAILEAKTALDAVVRIVREAAHLFPVGATFGGCFISSGELACGPEHRSIADGVSDARELMVTLLTQRITALNLFLKDVYHDQLILRDVATVIQGMSVQARDGANEATLLAIADVALAAWPSRPPSRQLPRTKRPSARTSRVRGE